jgi:hypothetical protein
MSQEFALVNSMNQKIWKNRTKIISVPEQNGLRIKVFQELKRTDIDEALLKWFKQATNDNVPLYQSAVLFSRQLLTLLNFYFMFLYLLVQVKVKVQHSHYWPGVGQTVPGSLSSQIS